MMVDGKWMIIWSIEIDDKNDDLPIRNGDVPVTKLWLGLRGVKLNKKNPRDQEASRASKT